MSIEIVIDTRERELIDKLSNATQINVEQLEIGDIIYRQNGDTILVIERKTVNDLKASICDGRGREQKARLLGNMPRKRILYLIEGSLNKPLSDKVSGLPVDTLVGSLVNTQFRDDIKVYKTASIEETANFLIKLLDKLIKDGDNYFNTTEEQTISATEYSSSLKKSKKANMTPYVWFIAQLSLIPQVTEKVAEEIVNVYGTPVKLVQTYETTPEHLREKLLADITYSVKNDKRRRIGDKMSGRIYHYFYGINSVEE